MKICIQELIRGHVEVIKEKDIVPDIIKELIDREIPVKIDYINDGQEF